MSLDDILLLIYIAGAVIAGIASSIFVWKEGTNDGVRPHNPVVSVCFSIFGLTWPLFLVLVPFIALFEWSDNYSRRHP